MKTWDLVEDIDETVKPFEDEEISEENGYCGRANIAVAKAATKI